jgi:hypothetical protein
MHSPNRPPVSADRSGPAPHPPVWVPWSRQMVAMQAMLGGVLIPLADIPLDDSPDTDDDSCWDNMPV